MGEVKFLSPSKVAMLQMCGEAFRLKYIEKISEPSSGTFQFGKVVHAVIEKALRQVILGSKLPSAKDMTDTVPEVWDAVYAEEEGKPGFIGWDWGEDDSPEKAKADIAPLVAVAREEVLRDIRPVHVEHGWNVMMDDGDGGQFRIYGIIDLLEQGGLVTDWKTANGKVSPFARKHDVQIDAYGYWVHQYMGLDVVKMRKVYLVRSKRPKVDCERYEVGPAHRERFERIARAAWRLIQSGGFVANPNTWKCSPKFCGYWKICPFGGSISVGEV
jgi:CRISPR/Cas system-associated exonuclease Cas4 (RecB family)